MNADYLGLVQALGKQLFGKKLSISGFSFRMIDSADNTPAS